MKKLLAVLCTLILVVFSVIPAFAVVSPEGTTIGFEITNVPSTGGDTTIEILEEYDDNSKDIIIRPKPDDGYEFDYWEIIGDYSTNGDLTDAELKLHVKGDVQLIPHFKKKSTGETPSVVVPDNSSSSPQTGSSDSVVYTVILLAVAACGIATFKLAKSK